MKIYKLNQNTCTPKQRAENKSYMLQLDHVETDQNPRAEEKPLHSSCGIETSFAQQSIGWKSAPSYAENHFELAPYYVKNYLEPTSNYAGKQPRKTYDSVNVQTFVGNST